MQNSNRFSHHYMYSVAPVNYYQQGLMFDGIYTVLRNPDNPGKLFIQGLNV